MVILDLFHRSGLDINVMHCHFGLRDDASSDLRLVTDYCRQRDIQIYAAYFPVPHLEHSEGIQGLCRKLRYRWFRSLMQRWSKPLLVTAHQLDDNIETLMLMLNRGAGISGLSGMYKLRKGHYRPLLEVSKVEIQNYAKANDVPYYEDSSNELADYDRNFFRLEILPRILKRFPGFVRSSSHSLDHLRECNDFVEDQLSDMKSRFTNYEEGIMQVSDLDKWPIFLLKFLLVEQGFNRDQVKDIIEKDHSVGSMFRSPIATLVFSSQGWTIEKEVDEKSDCTIEKTGEYDCGNGVLAIIRYDSRPPRPTDLWSMNADADKLEFPLTVRSWKQGDTIHPLGMSGRTKSVKSILSDNKVDRLQRKRVRVVEDKNGQIIWVVGYKVSEDVKIESSTNAFLQLEFIRK